MERRKQRICKAYGRDWSHQFDDGEALLQGHPDWRATCRQGTMPVNYLNFNKKNSVKRRVGPCEALKGFAQMRAGRTRHRSLLGRHHISADVMADSGLLARCSMQSQRTGMINRKRVN